MVHTWRQCTPDARDSNRLAAYESQPGMVKEVGVKPTLDGDDVPLGTPHFGLTRREPVANLSRIRPGPPARRRLCFAVDIESFSGRIQPQQLDLMRRLLWIMTVACENAGVSASRCERQDSGDGQILVLPPGVDESTVLPGFVL